MVNNTTVWRTDTPPNDVLIWATVKSYLLRNGKECYYATALLGVGGGLFTDDGEPETIYEKEDIVAWFPLPEVYTPDGIPQD